MQWQHKVRTPRLPNGVVITFAQEILRAMQDTFSLYQALSSPYARNDTDHRLPTSSRDSLRAPVLDLVQRTFGSVCMAPLAAMVYALYLAGFVLDR